MTFLFSLKSLVIFIPIKKEDKFYGKLQYLSVRFGDNGKLMMIKPNMKKKMYRRIISLNNVKCM